MRKRGAGRDSDEGEGEGDSEGGGELRRTMQLPQVHKDPRCDFLKQPLMLIMQSSRPQYVHRPHWTLGPVRSSCQSAAVDPEAVRAADLVRSLFVSGAALGAAAGVG